MAGNGNNGPEEERAQQAVRQAIKIHHRTFLEDLNIAGFGLGEKVAHGEKLGRSSLTIFVVKKMPPNFLPVSRLVPSKLQIGDVEVETDIVETGRFYPLSFVAQHRPAHGGDSIGHVNITAGTLGCLVTDNSDGTTCILSNNHVLADQNAAGIGDSILQPGPHDGGTVVGAEIARLKRFVTINTTATNQVDAAIAEPINVADVVNQMEGGLVASPSPGHRAVGLLFAGSCNTTIMNPIGAVLVQHCQPLTKCLSFKAVG